MNEKMEIEKELELKKIYLDALRQIMLARHSVIITSASLILAILVVATFNQALIAQTEILRWIIVFLLSLLPIVLFDYSLRLNKGEADLWKRIDQKKFEKSLKTPLWIYAVRRSDLIYILLISVSILWIILLITQSIFLYLSIAIIDFILIYIIEKHS